MHKSLLETRKLDERKCQYSKATWKNRETLVQKLIQFQLELNVF